MRWVPSSNLWFLWAHCDHALLTLLVDRCHLVLYLPLLQNFHPSDSIEKSSTNNVNRKLLRTRFYLPIQIDLNIFKRKLTFAVRLGDDFFVASCLLSKWKISRCVVIYSSNIFYKIHVELFIINKISKLLTWLSAICLLVEVNSKRLGQGLLEKGLPVSLHPFYH